MQFEDALKTIKENTAKAMRLPKWSPEVRVFAVYPHRGEVITHAYLAVKSRFGVVPWKETYPEIFDNTWEIVSRD